MAFVRFSRRRRFTFLRLFLILFASIGVLLWLYIRNLPDKQSVNAVYHLKEFPNSKDIYVKNKLNNNAYLKDALKSNIFVSKRESIFRNPALLHKLKAKTSNVPMQKISKDDSHLISNRVSIKQSPDFHVPQLRVTPGLGENGEPVILPKDEQILADKLFNEAAFNVYLSDRISPNRSVPDSRNPKCEYESYDHDLPTASVIIIFTNEIWSALIRTIHSVINRSPPHLLHEIILVDDFSEKDELKVYLKNYISQFFKPNLIKLIRFNNRQGLIRARLAGARLATGDVLVFLDSHCEANIQWLEPLLHRIKEKKSTVVCPIIDVIDDKTFEYYATNLEYFQIGGFTWNGHFTWIEISEEEERRRKSEIGPTRTPTMAGGLFAIDRTYFWEVGSYDSGMEIWGGENLEMSFRVWMCGGSLEIIPCSHVGHVFRSFHPYKFPGNKDTHGINTVRTVEVWMDDYKKYFYYHRPDLKNTDYGNISERLQLKKQLKCKSFQWYLDNIYPEKFIFDKSVIAYGSLRNPLSHLCLDTLNRDEDKSEPIGYFHCKPHSEIVINQLLSYTKKRELRIEENCAEVNSGFEGQTELTVIMAKCNDGENQKWTHKKGGLVKHNQSGMCLDAGKKKAGDDAVVKECYGGHLQVWWFENYEHPMVHVEDIVP
ncbi:polypeptide N-acetylgalactosaminyltransferase 1 [Trichonephila clavipes]|nr:polypeptide N-acetylgalactosaminyltransferase 1 [Trichonephila clavipes]